MKTMNLIRNFIRKIMLPKIMYTYIEELHKKSKVYLSTPTSESKMSTFLWTEELLIFGQIVSLCYQIKH